MNTNNMDFFFMISLPVIGITDDVQELFDELAYRPNPLAEVTRLKDIAEANLLAFQKYGLQFYGHRQDGTARPMSLPVSGKYILSPLAVESEKLPDAASSYLPYTQPIDFNGVWAISSMNGFGAGFNLSEMVSATMSELLIYPMARWFPDYNSGIAWAQISYCQRFYSRFLGTTVAPRIPKPDQLQPKKMFIDGGYSSREENQQESALLQKFLSLGLID